MQPVTVRLLRLDDEVPYASLQRGGIPLGWEHIGLDPEWTWVAEHQGSIVGILVCGYIFPMLLLSRIAMAPSAPPATPLLLLRRAMRDARRRGLVGYLTFLSDSAAAEGQLMRIVQRTHGEMLPASGVWAWGKL